MNRPRYTAAERARIVRAGGIVDQRGPSIAGGRSYREGDFIWTLEIRDYMTERTLTVKDYGGRIIGQRDPFAAGIPLSKAARTKAVQDCVASIIADWKARPIGATEANPCR